MGMFDSFYAACPECGRMVEFQSKAGPCVLARYTKHDVPVAVAGDLHGDTSWCACGRVVTLKTSQMMEVL